MRRRRVTRLALAMALAVAGTAGVASATATAAGAAPAAVATSEAPFGPVVTLITGDRVQLRRGGDPRATVLPGDGRERLTFHRYTERGDTFVVPQDAARLLAAGRLDRRLFNVTKLVEFGYDDRARPDLPLIVTYGGPSPAGPDRLRAAGGKVTRALPSVNGAALRQDKREVGAFWRQLGAANAPDIGRLDRIALDGPVRANLAESAPQIGAPQAWRAGHTGAGVPVAVLDTGVDASHPDLAGAVTEARDFTDSPSGTDDRHGHGTHVAATIAGDGAAEGGRYRGIAPDADLMVGKVLDDHGSGTESQVLAGMEWAAGRARVVNMSLGDPWPSDGTDPMSEAVNRLTAQSGTLFVIAAGNTGPSDEGIGSPAAADAALTVGAVDKQDELAEFSSRGPRWIDQAIKPDVTAPGVAIVAARAHDTALGEPVGERYARLSGTSMAAPHVAGAAAIVAGQRPGWRAGALKAALMGSAAPGDGLTVYQQGAGRVDVARATTQAVYATPASVSNGIVQWPHHDDAPIGTQVTYHNDGATELTLDLALDVRDPSGIPAPAGMFTVSTASVTVPPGGTASVTLTTDTRVGGPDGVYGGVLTATGGGSRIRTPVGVVREFESYDVQVTFLDGHGAPTPDYSYRFVDIDHPKAYLPYDPSGTVTARLPKGRFYLDSTIAWHVGPGEHDFRFATFVEPEIRVDGPARFVFDGRDARPISVTAAAHPEARSITAVLQFSRVTSWGDTGLGLVMSNFDDHVLRPSNTSATGSGQFTFTLMTELVRPDGSGGQAHSPYAYHLGWHVDGRVPAELTRAFADRELARIPTRYLAPVTGQPGWTMNGTVELSLPASVTHYYAPNVRWWFGDLFLGGRPFEEANWAYVASTGRTYDVRDREPQRWGAAVFGPAFPHFPSRERYWATREGDVLDIGIPTFSDQATDRYGYSRIDSGITELYRDGVKLAEHPSEGNLFARVPADAGTYRLHTEADRTSYSELSTRVTVDWTFRSERTPTERPLSLMAVRFAPRLDDHNRAPAGLPFPVPVYVQQQKDAQFGVLTELTAQVSYDDGRSWRPVRLLGHGPQRVALLAHPPGDGFASFRTTAADSAGNRVEQTIIRAYKIAQW